MTDARDPGELAFDSQKERKNYTNPLTGSVHSSRGLPGCPCPAADRPESTVSQAIKHTRELMDQQGITITPAPARIRTPAALYDHAADAGIILPAHLNPAAIPHPGMTRPEAQT
jgi:hypothetical protein